MSSEIDDILEPVTERLETDRWVHSAWLFGSAARGDSRPESDLDVAVWTGAPLSMDERLRLAAELDGLVDGVELDVVFLNDAGPVLRYEVVREGRRLVARDDREADDLEHRAVMEYLDTAHYRDLQQRLARESVR
jgi:predicted nucleotidyltransferase